MCQQMKGSTYWMEKDCFGSVAQYFCTAFQSRSPHRCGTWTRSVNKCISGNEGRGRRKNTDCIKTAWTYADDERLKYQNDHAEQNETSIVMAVRRNWLTLDR